MTKIEKITAILDGKGNLAFFEAVKAGMAKGSNYASFYEGISLDDLKKMARSHPLSDSTYFTRESDKDGMFVIQRNNTYEVYYRDGGTKFESMSFPTLDEARDRVLTQMAASFGIF